MEQAEQDIRRFMQIRNEIQNEISKIGPHVNQLQEAGKNLVSHFDVFRQIVKETQTQLPVIIQNASHNMAKTAAEQLSLVLESMLQDKVKTLDHSVHYASEILNEWMSTKYRKVIFFAFIGVLLSGLLGFGGGYIYARQNTYALPSDFIKMYALGLSVKDATLPVEPKEEVQQKQKIERKSLKKN